MTLDEARAELPDGVEVSVSYVLTRNLAQDQVLRQVPAAGKPVGETVQLVVRRAPTLVKLKPADLGSSWTKGVPSINGQRVRSAKADVTPDGVAVEVPDETQRLDVGIAVDGAEGSTVTVEVLDSGGKTIQRVTLREGAVRQLRLNLRGDGPLLMKTGDASARTSLVLIDPQAWTP